jgi:hypothetical protein
LYKSWCELQQSYYRGDCQFQCEPPSVYASTSSPPNPCNDESDAAAVLENVACAQQQLCSSGAVCACTAASCTANVSDPDIHFDVHLTTGALDGSVELPVTAANTHPTPDVHFTLSP